MRKQRRNRLLAIVLFIIGLALAIFFLLYALRENVDLYYTPSQIKQGLAPKTHLFRAGGLVVKGSVHRSEKDLTVQFDLTDTMNTITVYYTGILPDLFREGQGVVVLGRFNQSGVFVAEQVLAKHDANYTPPEVVQTLKQSSQYHAA